MPLKLNLKMPTYYTARIARIHLKSPYREIKAIQQEYRIFNQQGVLYLQTPPLYKLEQPEPAPLQNLAPISLSLQEAAAVEQDATATKQDTTATK